MDATQRVARAMRHTPRATHLPDREVPNARLDIPLPLFGGATNSQPSTVATMLVALDVHRGHRVLDVGAGSGWTTALLAWLVGTDGEVLGLELDGELARWGAERLARHGRGWARLEAADPTVLGRPSEGPYDRILVSAISARLPWTLVGQLTDGGVMVIPVDGQLWTCRRVGDDAEVTRSGAYRFVPLVEP